MSSRPLGNKPVRWAYDTIGNRTGWANAGPQYYAAARRENSRIEYGVLILEARRESTRAFDDSGGQRYTSARLLTWRAVRAPLSKPCRCSALFCLDLKQPLQRATVWRMTRMRTEQMNCV
jgi:hypothetical protein